MVKRGYGSSAALVYGGLAALLLVAAAVMVLNFVLDASYGGSFLAESLVYSVGELAVFALLGGWFLFGRRESIRFDARRQAAADGSGAVLSLTTLGMAEPTPLALPTTLCIHLEWRSWFWRIMFLVLLALMQVVAIGATLSYQPQLGQWPSILYFVASEAGVIAFLLLMFWIMSLAARGQFRVTEEGLSARYFGMPQFVRWHEARLLARIGANQFEVASSTGIVRFSYLQDEQALKPTIPFDEYRAAMSAVFALIAERTGLPLIDLYGPKKR